MGLHLTRQVSSLPSYPPGLGPSDKDGVNPAQRLINAGVKHTRAGYLRSVRVCGVNVAGVIAIFFNHPFKKLSDTKVKHQNYDTHIY